MSSCLMRAVVAAAVLVSPCAAQVVETTVCEVLANPAAFDGKTVRIRGQVILQMEDFSLAEQCPGKTDVSTIWLEYGYPEPSPTPYCCPGGFDEKGKPIFSAPRVTLARDRNFEQLKRYLTARRDGKDRYGEDCDRYRPAVAECHKYTVTATLTGRLFGVVPPDQFAGGFGHFGMFPAKLVIRRVEEVAAVEIKNGKRVAPARPRIRKARPRKTLPPQP